MVNNCFSRLVPLGRILEIKDYYVWCCSPVYDETGRVHVYYSRWPKRGGFQAWQVACEVHHASALEPEGPYDLHGPVLKGTGEKTWDSFTVHNPSIYRTDGKYVLLYMANDGSSLNVQPETLMNYSEGELRRKARPLFATKKIGMAVSDTPEGPFRRLEGNPVVDSGTNGAWDSFHTSNPAFVITKEGRYRIYYKGYDHHSFEHSGGNRKYGFAESDNLTGPYVKSDANPVIDLSLIDPVKQCEDAYIWREGETYKLIMRDMGLFGSNNGLYAESIDGKNWSSLEISYRNAEEYLSEEDTIDSDHPLRLERPQLLMRGEKPEYLFCALAGGREQTSTGFVLKLT